LFMSEEDLRSRLSSYGAGHYTFERIAVTQSDTSKLPSFSAKDKSKDPRYGWFTQRYGDRCWELDAMDPNELRDRVKQEIEIYIDSEEWKQHQMIEKVQRETTRQVAEAFSKRAK